MLQLLFYIYSIMHPLAAAVSEPAWRPCCSPPAFFSLMPPGQTISEEIVQGFQANSVMLARPSTPPSTYSNDVGEAWQW